MSHVNGWCPTCHKTTLSVENLMGYDTWICDQCLDPVGVRPLAVGGWFHQLTLRLGDLLFFRVTAPLGYWWWAKRRGL